MVKDVVTGTKSIARPPEQRSADGERARQAAIKLARDASDMLTALGISVRIVGSLAKARFTAGSDIDFLIETCPRHLKYAIEGRVEDCLKGHPFDVLYLDEIRPERQSQLLQSAVHARHLR